VTMVPKVNNNFIVGSNAKVDRSVNDPVTGKIRNPGFPFWIAGSSIPWASGPRRPPGYAHQGTGDDVECHGHSLVEVRSDQADGGTAGSRVTASTLCGRGEDEENVVSAKDFSKVIGKAKPVYYPEEGTDLEQAAMAFHAQLHHDTFFPDGTPATGLAGFRTTGAVVRGGRAYHNPCIDDDGQVLDAGLVGNFFSGEARRATRRPPMGGASSARTTPGSTRDLPPVRRGPEQGGVHFPQQRIIALLAGRWRSSPREGARTAGLRFNTFDCMVYHNSNLVPEAYEMDDYEVRTPTDIIAQHIHLRSGT